jgi:hypothetical protein
VPLDRTSARYRLALLSLYLAYERDAVAHVAASAEEVDDLLAAPATLRDYQRLQKQVDAILEEQDSRLRGTHLAAMAAVAGLTLRFHEAKSGASLIDPELVARLTEHARASIIAGKTVGTRITLLAGEERTALRLRLLLGLRKNESPQQLQKAVRSYYRGVANGSQGAAYAAKRLVQSEITRFNGNVSVEASRLVREQTGRITVFDYHTQGDDRVRDTHSSQEGRKFVDDDVAFRSAYEPVSTAQSYLGEPNCRCWLDVSSYL